MAVNTTNMNMNKNKGKGWFGDPEGHAKAGKKGGQARGKNQKSSNKLGQTQDMES